MGYYLDCRDCVFFSCIHWSDYTKEGKFTCDKSCEYFDDAYGIAYPYNNCTHYVDADAVREEKERERKSQEEIAGLWLALQMLENNEQEEEPAHQEQNSQPEKRSPELPKNIVKAGNYLKTAFYIILFLPMLASTIFVSLDYKSADLDTRIKNHLYSDAWKVKDDKKTLFYMMNINTIPFLFDKEHVSKIYQKYLNAHNKRVSERKAERNKGYIVKPRDTLYDTKIRAYFTNNVKMKGSTENRVILISENVSDPSVKYIEQNCEAIPLEKYD